MDGLPPQLGTLANTERFRARLHKKAAQWGGPLALGRCGSQGVLALGGAFGFGLRFTLAFGGGATGGGVVTTSAVPVQVDADDQQAIEKPSSLQDNWAMPLPPRWLVSAMS